MFVGARLTFHQPLRMGVPAIRDGTIRDVTLKSGRSGALAFVTVAYRYTQNDVLCLEEEQDIVYREAGLTVAAPVVRDAFLPSLSSGGASCTVTPDPRLLFRFSALTFNAHRIQYDRDYARSSEGYPGLVVHGPLTAMLLLRPAEQQTTRPIERFSFRGIRPLFDLAPFRLVAQTNTHSVSLEAHAPDHAVAVTAIASLGNVTANSIAALPTLSA